MTELERFKDIVAQLRDPVKGCPWDRVQTHRTLRRFLVEETGEYLEAVELDDVPAMKDELGDILLQVVLNAQVAQDEGKFTLEDVAASESAKMIRRHPHVFSGMELKDEEARLAEWERVKKEEKGEAAPQSVVDGIPRCLPGLVRAQKVMHRAARARFKWESLEQCLNKVSEEVTEVRQAAEQGDTDVIEEEIGDLLIATVAACDMAGVQAEEAMHRAIAKFMKRFKMVEQMVDLKTASLAEMMTAWTAAKHQQE